ncbi:KAP family P-loop NTPase fold protein [Stutzerimonas stutzeri]|uniref:KAP family P-loop NTPase fold protein n=1 Tax=Stutzerimonas stutzeri TaxID=316 RepID=UPI000698F82E|nr:P-loop NTPase fold protein [Stutzerimonas stutzeri]
MTNKIAWRDDLMSREKNAQFLTSYIDESEHISVVNINSPWGTGKTFFITNWRLDLMPSRATVYFNAWENDYTGDPLISLVANIRDQLEKCLPSSVPNKRKLSELASSAGAAIAATAPIAIKHITKKFTGLDADEIAEAGANATSADGFTTESLSKFAEELIKNNKKSNEAVADFKKKLSALVHEAKKHNADKPVYIFIDELDRCRPTYSIELLERVKHFFDIPNCKFIIATDTSQLAHSVNAVYGMGFSSSLYLKRFFELTYTFPKQGLDGWIKAHVKDDEYINICSLGYLSQSPSNRGYSFASHISPGPDCIFDSQLTEPQLTVKLLAETFGTDLRQLLRVLQALSGTSKQMEGKPYHFFFAAYLTFIMHHEEEIFSKLVSEDLDKLQAHFNQKYPSPGSLYFGTEILEVHALANKLLKVWRMPQAEARNLFHSNSISQISYIANMVLEKANHKEPLKGYYELVSLAAGIE